LTLRILIFTVGAIVCLVGRPPSALGQETPPPPATAPVAPPAVPKAPAADPRKAFDLGVDVGAGVLEFFHADLSLLTQRKLARLLAFGVGVGGFPLDTALNLLMGTDGLSAAARVQGITVKRSVQTKLVSMRGFGRWYLFRKCFFGELSVEAWRLEVGTRGTATADDYGELIEVEATATVWVPMIGIHGGWRFLFERGFFLEIAGGLDVFLSPGAEVALGGTTVDQLREYEDARAVLENMRKFLGGAVEDGANRLAKRVPVFPTGTIRLGWAFDVW
jgi:hypothetical protein